MTEDSICSIWGTRAVDYPSNRDGREVDSPRAGGRYFISETEVVALQAKDDHLKARLTTWLVKQRSLGNACPEINTTTIKDAEDWRDMNIHDRGNGILKYLERKSNTLGTKVPYISYDLGAKEYAFKKVYYELLSHSGCIDQGDLTFLLNYLGKRGLIENTDYHDEISECILTFDGYAKLDELEKNPVDSLNAFVAMWFDPSMNAARDKGIKPAIKDAGYDPVLIDEQEHINKIDDEIIAEIRRSRFVVADFTHEDKEARGGVYYEAGFAYGLGIPVIFTCRKNTLENIHFDTRQYNHIVWENPEDLKKELLNRISAVIGDGPNKPQNS